MKPATLKILIKNPKKKRKQKRSPRDSKKKILHFWFPLPAVSLHLNWFRNYCLAIIHFHISSFETISINKTNNYYILLYRISWLIEGTS